MKAGDIFDARQDFPFRDVFDLNEAPWQWLPKIGRALAAFDFPVLANSEFPPGLEVRGQVFFGENVKLPAYSSISGPAYIGPDCDLRPGVFIRGNVITGHGCVLGNSCEFKNCLLLDGVQTPHFNYVGDSILGNHAHLGAGAILSNLRFDQDEISVKTPEGLVRTGLRKLGAILGDEAEVGCNVSLQPGTLLARRSVVFPGLAFGGLLREGMMAVGRQDFRVMERPHG